MTTTNRTKVFYCVQTKKWWTKKKTQLLEESDNQLRFTTTNSMVKPGLSSKAVKACRVTESALLQRPNCFWYGHTSHVKSQPHPNPARILSTLLPTSIAVYCQGCCLWIKCGVSEFICSQAVASNWHPAKPDVEKHFPEITLLALLRKLLGLGNIYQTIIIYSQWFCC